MLKAKNQKYLWMVVALNVIVFVFAMREDGLTVPTVEHLKENLGTTIPAGLSLLITVVLNALLPPRLKAALVYWRWHNILPGHFAFTKYGPEDPRVDLRGLEKKLGELPSDPMEQNRVWYQLYKSVKADAAVDHVHGEYLLLRDWAGLAFLSLVVLGVVGVVIAPSWRSAVGYAALALLQYVVVRTAAEHAGVRFVTTVMATVPTS